MKRNLIAVSMFLLVGTTLLAQPAARILSLQGSVQIRRSLEENWRLAAAGMPLEAGDTILTGENSEAQLRTADGALLRLGAQVILDVADLKRLSEREMFLWLISEKIDRLPQRQEKTPLRFGQITSVHGEEKGRPAPIPGERAQRWRAEVNGLLVLLVNAYSTNAVVKCHKILRRYPEQEDCGEVHFYLGQTLESLGQAGQAAEAYQEAAQRVQSGGCSSPAAAERSQKVRESLQRLRGSQSMNEGGQDDE